MNRFTRHVFRGAAVLSLVAPALSAQECPTVDPDAGYPVLVVSADTVGTPMAWLETFVQAAVYRWRVPSRRRNAYRGWERVRDRLLPPEPRWAADWHPEAHHVATLDVVMERGGDIRYAIRQASGDGRFDKSLESIFRKPMPGAPPFPPVPTALASDSVPLSLQFGIDTATAPHALVRFAAVQTPVRLIPGTLRVDTPRGSRRPSATVKYDVTRRGTVAPGSIQILRASDGRLGRAIEAALRGARFEPATSNCRAISQTVVQTFGN